MDKINYRNIILESSFGYAYYSLILDEKGAPADYLFIEANRAFEEMTGVSRESITGKTATEIFPGDDHETAERIQLYGSSVLNKKKIVLEQYSEFLRKWYRVEVSPQNDLHFVTIFSDITELEENKNKFEQYIKYSPYGIYITDSKGIIIFVNPVACNSIGYSDDELLNRSVVDLLTQANRAEGMEGIKTLLETDSDSRDLLLKKKTGEHIWVALKTVKLPDGNFLGFLRDISDRKEAEIRLKQFAMFNKTLLETIPLPVYYKDVDGKYIGLNRAMENLYGISRDKIEGKNVYEISLPSIAERYKQKDEELLQEPGVQIFEDQWTNVAGETRDVIFHKATFNDIHGNVGGIIGALVDVTGLKKTHRELELYFRAIQSVDQPVLITDSRGEIIRVNNAFIKMYGFTFDELKGKNPNILNPGRDVYINFGYTDDEYEGLFGDMWKSITSPEKGIWEGVLINRKKDGAIIWVKLLINAVYNDEHVPVNYIALPVDITGTIQKETMTRVDLYRTIAALSELRDNETGNHMRRVGIFAKLLARGYNMPEKYCNDIEIFAPLHDIGKVGILDSLLLAERSLTPEEFNIMKTHTILGYNIVKGNRELEMVAAITLNHHEWYDGTGYPNGIKGLDIPLSARITAVADVYDALRCRRPYKGEWTHEEAVRYITGKSGVQFDPDVTRIFYDISDRIDGIYRELKD